MSTAISVNNISKLYRLGETGTGSIAHDVNRWWHKIRGNEDPYLEVGQSNDRTAKSKIDYVYAIKDVSFDVKQGEVLGIIGRNGAGKSTLLKILSRVTAPTKGQINIKGRIASLLEVGTGFHQELTGRENIYLNGAILGMRKSEIRDKFDEILDFSGCELYIDTPVKRYSSGMYVRLAFAVAAHLEPEILIVDEVLAVGDAEFQKKCMGKMKDVAGQGRTVIFVSHQIASITRLCQSVLWMDRGKLFDHGSADLICSQYLANGSNAASHRVWESDGKPPGNEWVRLESISALSDGRFAENMNIKSAVEINMDYRVLKGGKILIPNLHFYSDDGTLIFISHDWFSGWRETQREPGLYRTKFTVPGNFFSEGRITVNAAITTYLPLEEHFTETDAIAFTVLEADDGDSSRGDFAGHLPGIIRPIIATKTEIITK
jgi:lipopolysaccharide transport system ATP-binding protein